MNFDTIARLVERLESSFARPAELLIELLLIGLSVNWCAGVLHGTRGTRLLRGLLIVLVGVTLVVRVLAAQLGWTRLELLYRYVIIGLAFIALVAFQPELRRALLRAGDVRWLRRVGAGDRLVGPLVESAAHLSRNRHGALIAIQRDVGLADWAELGVPVGAQVSANLLDSIFFPNSPLHDLGVILHGDHIVAAACQFPMCESGEVDASLGSRHRAAVGLSQESDALVLCISEETGIISLADGGKLLRPLTLEQLESELRARLTGAGAGTRDERGAPRLTFAGAQRALKRALIVLPLTLLIWFLADQASLVTRDGVAVELQPLADPTRTVVIDQPASPVFVATISGATRDVETIRGLAARGALDADWRLEPPFTKPGVYTLSGGELVGFLNALPAIRGRGVSILRIAPESLTFAVDELITVHLPVQAESGTRRLSDVRFDPPEVSVSLARGDWERLDESQRFVRAPLADAAARLSPDDLLDEDRVALDLNIGPVRARRLDPSEVAVTARVAANTTRRRIGGVAVQIVASVPFLQRYEIEAADDGEWLIELEIEGDRTVVDRVRTQDVSAYVPLSAETPTAELRAASVVVVLPPGVSLVGRPPQVQYRLNLRNGAAP